MRNLLTAAVCTVFICITRGCGNVTLLAAQLDALLATYEREAPPAAPLTVRAGLDVRHAAVLEDSSTMRLLADLSLTWQDDRIAWNATEWGCSTALASSERLWLPDVTLLNAAGGAAGDASLKARLSSDGAVRWLLRLDVATPVPLALDNWPSDQQRAIFKFGSRAHTTDEIVLKLARKTAGTNWETGPWEIRSVKGAVTTWSRDEWNTSLATWTVGVRRRAPAHAAAAGSVLAAAALLLMAAAALPPTARPPLYACAAFITAIWLVAASARLPHGAGTPVAVSALGGLCALSGLAAGGAALVSSLARRARPPPPALRALLASAASVFPVSPEEGAGAAGANATWVSVSRLLDFVLQLLVAATLGVLLALYV